LFSRSSVLKPISNDRLFLWVKLAQTKEFDFGKQTISKEYIDKFILLSIKKKIASFQNVKELKNK